MRQTNRVHLFTLVPLLVTVLLGAAHAQVAVYQTQFPTVTMPNKVGQHVLLGTLPLGPIQSGFASFDFQATGSFQGGWSSNGVNDVQESFDLYFCDKADCSGASQVLIGHLVLVPFGVAGCMGSVLTLRGSFAQSSGGVHGAIFTGMVDGLWTGRPTFGTIRCASWLQNPWGDGLANRPAGWVTGPIAALPSLSNDSVDTTQSLFLVLKTTLTKDDAGVEGGTGQMSLMRVVVYPQ